ncbi:MAG: glycosyltransferase involved in cell wall biosynthesis [Lysobacterales bacterium]|jgi:glycosyltransferase involved in cell wall biosynthesis
MQILHIITPNNLNLIEKPVHNLLKGLDFCGVKSTVLYLGCAQTVTTDTVVSLQKECDVTSPSQVRRAVTEILKEKSFDIVHVHDLAVKGIVCTAKKRGVKSVGTFHKVEVQRLPFWNHIFCGQMVANSDYVARELAHNKITSLKKIKTVYTGIDIEEFDTQSRKCDGEALRTEYNISKETFIIGAIGSLVLDNDYETLFKAFRNARAKEMDAVLCVVGNGKELKNLEGVATEFKIKDRVRFIESTDYVAMFNLFNAFVSVSYREEYMVSILGAMAASKPVIASKIGANPEMIVQGKTGFLVPCGFPERADNVIMRWNANPQFALDVGQAGRELLEEKFSVHVMGAKYKEVYETLIN